MTIFIGTNKDSVAEGLKEIQYQREFYGHYFITKALIMIYLQMCPLKTIIILFIVLTQRAT